MRYTTVVGKSATGGLQDSTRTIALDAPVTALPGIGPTLAERLGERDVRTVEDLLWLVPRRYDDVRQVTPLADAVTRALSAGSGGPSQIALSLDDNGGDDGDAADSEPDALDSQTAGPEPGTSALLADRVDGRVNVGGLVHSSRFHRRGRQRWVELRLGDPDVPPAGGQATQILIRWFNGHPSLAKKLAKGSRLVVSGRLTRRGFHAEMANPDILEIVSAAGVVVERARTIIPRYPDLAGVPAGTLRKACGAALERAGAGLIEGVPEAVRARLGLCSLGQAVAMLHRPPDSLPIDVVAELDAGKSEWHRRLAFEELFILGLAIAWRRRSRASDAALPCPAPGDRETILAGALPYVLTGAQKRAIALLSSDLVRPVAMNRLLQGDVGSGKTAVAFAAAHQCIASGRQVAFMAPTEILAEQHHGTLSAWCDRLGIRAALLTASTPLAARRSLLRALDVGYLQLVVGTHALLSEGVTFQELGLVIIDEQHRFGVAQRVELRQKGARAVPHLLVMTATPIPRTLALTAYGDLDVTLIDEMPPGRTPPTTLVLSGASGRERAHALVRERLDRGERVFVVCPLIDRSEDEGRKDWADAVSTSERLASTFAPARVGLVHGRMAQAERDRVMQEFRSGALAILVATTVIEVGVDVPEATVMVILDAQHFGLAQLHQLRGRVGRGGGESFCLLMTRRSMTPEGAQRLAVMAGTSDGFRIAEEDLVIRGPGEIMGVRQHGLPSLRFGDLRQHAELLVKARDAADEILASDPSLERPEHSMTRRALLQRTAGLTIYGAESG